MRQGVSIKIAMLGQGDICGEVALLFDTARMATVAATTDAEVYVLSRHVYHHLVKKAKADNDARIQVRERESAER